jgi:hypothetical protein
MFKVLFTARFSKRLAIGIVLTARHVRKRHVVRQKQNNQPA